MFSTFTNARPQGAFIGSRSRKESGVFRFLLVVLLTLGAAVPAAFAARPAKAMPTFIKAAVSAAGPHDTKARHNGNDADVSPAKAEKNAYDYSLPGADGKDIPLSGFKGKYILVVNLGRKSDYNVQLPALVKFYDTYKDKGFVVIGVPCDDFGAAEPGSNADVQKVYTDAKVDFPVTAVAKLVGDDQLPLYSYLTKSKAAPAGGAVHWNYTKFIIDKKGDVIARFNPDVAPDSPELLSTVDQILDGRYKPKKAGAAPGEPAAAAADDDDDDE